MIGGSVLTRRRMNGLTSVCRRSVRLVVLVALDGHGEVVAESLPATQVARVEEVHDATTARTGGSPPACRSGPCGSRPSACGWPASAWSPGFLMFCASSRITPLHRTSARSSTSRCARRIGGDHHVVLARPALDELVASARARCRGGSARAGRARSARPRAASCPPPRSGRSAARAASAWRSCASLQQQGDASGSSCPGPCRRPGTRPGPSAAGTPARRSPRCW